MGIASKKLLYLVTEDWYFMSHRVDLASAALAADYSVTLVTQISSYSDEIRSLGIKLVSIIFPRSLKRPWQDLITLKDIFTAYAKYKPDIIHHVSLKPIVYGSFILKLGACRGSRPVVLNAFTGLGFVFTSGKFSARLIRLFLIPVLKMFIGVNNSFLLFQNEDDKQAILDLGIAQDDHCFLIPGSGVDIHEFSAVEEYSGIPVCMLVGRMLYDKGVEDFVNAARVVKQRGIDARFVLIGDTDQENPAGIPTTKLQLWNDEGVVEWWGRRDDMQKIYAESHVVILPSHREGFPKTVIEAEACGRPVITTNVPGCRDAIIPGETGLLVPMKDPAALADAMAELILNKNKRIAMGKAGRELVVRKFSTDVINSQFLDLYRNMLEKSTI